MPSIFVTKPPFPVVPLVPGVPILARSLLVPTPNSITGVAAGASSGSLFHAAKSASTWGVYDSSGNIAIAADSVREFDYRAEWSISNYPIQNGQFASYNKVLRPYDTSVLLVKGGTEAQRAAFLAQVDVVANSAALYTILTPEKTYVNVNVSRVQMSRKQSAGAYFVAVELYFENIAQVNAQYTASGTQGVDTSNASTPQALPTVNNGIVQAQPPTPQVQAVVASKLTGGG